MWEIDRILCRYVDVVSVQGRIFFIKYLGLVQFGYKTMKLI